MITKQDTRGNFTIISNEIIRNKELSINAKMVAVFIASLPKDWIVNTKHLSNELGLSVRSVQRAIKDLIDLEFITKIQHTDKNGKFANGFSVIFINNDTEIVNAKIENETKMQAQENEGQDKNLPTFKEGEGVNEAVLNDDEAIEVLQNEALKDATNSRKRICVAHIKKEFLRSKNLYLMRNFNSSFIFVYKKSVAKQELDFKQLNQNEIERLKEWFLYKEARGKRLNVVSKNKLVSKCLKFKENGENVIAIIDKAIENGWAGLFSLKKQGFSGAKIKTKRGIQMEQKAILRAVLEQEPNFDLSEEFDLSKVKINGLSVKYNALKDEFTLIGA